MDFGNVSEIVAAVAVVVSLIYLAVQVRENTHAAKLAATRELLSAAHSAIAANSVDPEISEIWLVGIRDRSRLNHRDGFRFTKLLFEIFSAHEQQFFHLEESLIHAKLFESQIKAYEAALVWPGVREWWETNRNGFNADFQAHVDALIRDLGEKAPSDFVPDHIKIDV